MGLSEQMQRHLSQYNQEYACILLFDSEGDIRITPDNLSERALTQVVRLNIPSLDFSSVERRTLTGYSTIKHVISSSTSSQPSTTNVDERCIPVIR